MGHAWCGGGGELGTSMCYHITSLGGGGRGRGGGLERVSKGQKRREGDII